MLALDPTLFDLATQHMRWLSDRQALVAENVANVNSPDFRPRDVEKFSSVLEKTGISMARTDADHLALSRTLSENGTAREDENSPWAVTYSGNSVNLEEQMLKANEVRKGFSIDTAVVKVFHRMFLSCAKVS